MGAGLAELVALLDLEQIEQDIFRGRSPAGEQRQRIFGGQVASQALVAAGRTVPADRAVHSLHAYFIRPGDPSVPLLYLVERVRDGRSFTTRRVQAVQHGRTIFTLSASFQVTEPGPQHADVMPQVPGPETIEPAAQRLRRLGLPGREEEYLHDSAIELRHAGPLTTEAAADPSLATSRSLVWLRANGDLPDDPLLHVCVMTYASDMTLLDTVLLAHGLTWRQGLAAGASLDHAMWFHQPSRADSWLLFVQDSPFAGGARGLARGQFYSQDGRLVASAVQEGMLRPR